MWSRFFHVAVLFVILLFAPDKGGCQSTTEKTDIPTKSGNTTNRDSVLKAANRFTFKNNCTVDPVNPKLRHDLREMLLLGTKLIQIQLHVVNHTGALLGELESSVYRPLSWARSAGRQGRSMLLLKAAFKSLSLNTLGYGVEEIDVQLVEDPPKCLVSKDVTEIVNSLRELLLNDFERPSKDGRTGGSIGKHEHVCNMYIKDKDGTAMFHYVCCHKSEHGKIFCENLEQDVWMTILFLCIFSLNFVFIMFSPRLIPESMYREKYKNIKYQLALKKPLEVTILKKRIRKMSDADDNVISLNTFSQRDTPKFREKLDEMKVGTPYTLTISKLEFKVKAGRLIPRNEAPVGVASSLYDSLVRCKIREKDSLRECCTQDMFRPGFPCAKRYPWYKCLQTMMFCVVLVIIAIPWAIRLSIYYLDEHIEQNLRAERAKDLDLKVPFPGNLLGFLTPIHFVFVFCYSILIFDFVMFGILSKNVIKKFQIVIRKCFRDMKESSRTRALGWSMKLMLIPFQKFGVCALFTIWIYWIVTIPFVLIVLSFYFLPTLNITVRLLVHFFAYSIPYGKSCPAGSSQYSDFCKKFQQTFGIDFLTKKENLERPSSVSMRDRLFQLIVIFICIVSMFSFVLLVMECVVFFVEIAVYTMIGIIINASHMMKYVTLIFMLVLYAKDCFGSVRRRYLVFNDSMISALQKKASNEVKSLSWKNSTEPKNHGIQVDTEHEIAGEKSRLVVRNGVLKWDMPRVVLFLDKDDRLKITKRFFFQTAYLPYAGCPGHLFSNLFGALFQLLLIIIFLLFVLLVVMAFGESYRINSTNQMLATLVGGFLPWIFRKVLFQSPSDLVLDTDSLHFQNLLDAAILDYHQNWPISDLVIDNFKEKGKNDPSTKREVGGKENGNVGRKMSEKDVFYDCQSQFDLDKPLIEDNTITSVEDHVDVIINTLKDENLESSFKIV